MYNAKTYEVSVLETKPAAAISVIECDLNVDFAPPIGYQGSYSVLSRLFPPPMRYFTININYFYPVILLQSLVLEEPSIV